MPAPETPPASTPVGRWHPHRRDPALVREYMTPRAALATLSPEATLREAAELLASRHVTGAPVLVGSEVVGVLSASDLMEFTATTPAGVADDAGDDAWEDQGDDAGEASDAREAFLSAWIDAGEDVAERVAAGAAGHADPFEEHTVAEVMCTRLISIPPGAELQHAAEVMHRASVHRLLVLEAGRLAGLVTSTDVLRAVAAGRVTTLHG